MYVLTLEPLYRDKGMRKKHDITTFLLLIRISVMVVSTICKYKYIYMWQKDIYNLVEHLYHQ